MPEALKPSSSQIVLIRDLAYHVRTWGEADAPKLFMLHGWMDVGASFQFLVDALERDWHVIAPDWRGFGKSAWCADGYWFADYIADLEAILDAFAPHEPARLVGHSLGGNVVTLYAGIRPERVAKVVSLDGFGIPAEDASNAPGKYAKWLDALRDPPAFAPYATLASVADRLQKNNPRLSRDKAEFLASHWAEVLPDGSARLVSDPRHKLPFPIVYRVEEVQAIWARVAAPVLWVGASDSFILKWLGDGERGLRERMSALPDCRLVTIPDAGHMLHHDQPAAVAAAIEPFLG
ncbi:MAG TPA: alpha/beta hydrolase [Casimicrobiaceae bacterium]|nr:alpha/beta hydrolase [Casimicrobiaceae bacterium]